jgi:hypothetical protein
MSIEAMKLALEALQEAVYKAGWIGMSPEGADEIQREVDEYVTHRLEPAITSLRTAIEAADEQEAWKTSDTAYRPGGLPQDFIKHEVENEGDWSEWVNPNSEQYFMKCCDCGLVHKMQFKVVKYSEGDECKTVNDPSVQAVFRARRTTPPAAQRTEQEPVAHCEAGPEFCPVCRAETRSLALAAAVGYIQRNTPTLVWTEICNALATTPPAQPAPVQEPVAMRDVIAVNLMREGINNKHRARELADHFISLITPPAAQRQPLTDKQIDDIWNRYCDEMGEASINDAYDIARALEAAHGIKEST